MTFIPAAVCSSYRGCEKTFVIPKPRVNFIHAAGARYYNANGSKVKRVGGTEIHLCV